LETRTYEDFMKFLGANPARLGIVSTLYDQYTATHLTEALLNTYTLEKGKKNAFQSIDSFVVEWDINVNRIKRVNFISVPEGDGANGSDIIFRFGENYYQKFDTFIIENTRQLIIVLNRPQRISDNEWVVIGKIQDSDYGAVLDTSGCQPGMATRFVTNYMPEMHEEGYVKYQSNVERHRTYIGTHRADASMSAQYNAMEDVFIQIGKGQQDDPIYRLNTAEKDCLDSFMEARNNACLWGKTNMDVYGKPKIFDPETGRPIIAPDGIIAQIERFATKFAFSRLNTKFFHKALQVMVTKSTKPTGNNYLFLCNTPMWTEIQETLSTWIRDWKTVGTFVFSTATNGYIDLGATYNSYEFAGNTVTFKVDRSFDIEYPRRKFGIFLDLTADAVSGKAALNMFTFKRGEIIHNFIKGVGGSTGLQHGEVSSPVAASKIINWGYAGVGVYNPYRSVILISEEVKTLWF